MTLAATALAALTDVAAAAQTAGPTVLKSLPHHAVFLLLLQIAVLLFTARLLGEIMRKLGQPAVIGELVAGVALGPSVLGALAPQLQQYVFPPIQSQADLLSVVSWLGVLFLILATGFETDIGLIKRRGKYALIISSFGISIPLAAGVTFGFFLPDAYLADVDKRLVFALFMAVSMSICAVPVIAKVLMDLKLIRRDIGQLILASAMTDDTVGWILLSVVAGLATAGSVDPLSIGQAIGGALLFLGLMLTIGVPIFSKIISGVDKRIGGANAQMSLIVALAFGCAALTHQMGIEAVLGAFAVGILVGQAPRFRKEVAHTLEMTTASFLAPIFFASAGVKVNLALVAKPEVAIVGLAVLGLACACKISGVYIGAWAAGLSHWERLAMGFGMNARGAMEIVVATVGLGLGILTVEMYSIIVMVAIVTSLMAPPMLRWCLGKVKIGDHEAHRLETEAVNASSFIRQIRRVMIVTRSAHSVDLPAQLVGYLSHEQPIECTAIYARPQAVHSHWWQVWSRRTRRYTKLGQLALERIRRPLRLLKGSRPELKLISDPHPAEQVLVEAERDYELIVLGENRRAIGSETLLGGIVDEVVRKAPCPCLIVREPPTAGDGKPPPYRVWSPKKILVPTVGTEYSKNAVELAAVLAASTQAELTIVHISRTDANDVDSARPRELGDQIVAREAERGRKFGASITTAVHEGARPEELILGIAREGNYDLIVIGSSLRAVSARAFFGHRVESMLKNAHCPVVVLSAG
jgi:Kef-type K+ transport system membrane component KefB/nucleotide-binding universal stress UspA family protein